MLYDHLDRDHHCLLQGPSWSYLACKLKIYAKWKSKQIENLCTLKLYANWNFMQIESLCKSKIHANWKFRQIENWTSKKLKWRYLKKWKSKVGACRLKMRSPFKRSGRGQCQGSRLKITPGCKTECALLYCFCWRWQASSSGSCEILGFFQNLDPGILKNLILGFFGISGSHS